MRVKIQGVNAKTNEFSFLDFDMQIFPGSKRIVIGTGCENGACVKPDSASIRQFLEENSIDNIEFGKVKEIELKALIGE